MTDAIKLAQMIIEDYEETGGPFAVELADGMAFEATQALQEDEEAQALLGEHGLVVLAEFGSHDLCVCHITELDQINGAIITEDEFVAMAQELDKAPDDETRDAIVDYTVHKASGATLQ